MRNLGILAAASGLLGQPVFAQASGGDDVDAGPACRVSGLRDVTNVGQLSPGVAADPFIRSKLLSDANGDGTADTLLVDYYEDQHFAAVICGVTGDILYSMESIGADDYHFATDATPVGDADGDGVDDFLLLSQDMLLLQSDILLISGANGSGIARLSRSTRTDSSVTFDVFFFSDVDKSGSSTSQDVYIVLDASLNAAQPPVADLNFDGVVNAADVALAGSYSGPVSTSSMGQIATALGGTFSGQSITVTVVTVTAGVFDWLSDIWGCASCLINCGSAYDLAWECRGKLKQAECDCWELPDAFDISACLDDLRLNFMSECIQLAAGAAGECGQCILDCHPLAP